DSIMNQIYSKGTILDIIDNSSFQDFSTRYNYDNGYNQVIPHTKPSLVDKSYNNTVYENITVDGANKVAELEASGLNPDTLNIATSMVMFGFDPKHVTIALNNPLLKEYFVRLKAREITEGWSISNQANTLAEMRNTYLPASAIDI
ncbi:MAG TPA: hypothetical protein PLP73_04610, partial [Candidatus Absconditabacterales bacterium]|nr:hypothetical protein [Candidatus Absconditabacterales bacterium]